LLTLLTFVLIYNSLYQRLFAVVEASVSEMDADWMELAEKLLIEFFMPAMGRTTHIPAIPITGHITAFHVPR
jgi:hypothetical protein